MRIGLIESSLPIEMTKLRHSSKKRGLFENQTAVLWFLPLLLLALSLAACSATGDTVPADSAAPVGMPFPDGAARFTLVPEETSAGFAIAEILLGEPKIVTAESRGVSGELAVDFDTPANTAVGPISVATNQFVTDNDFRNEALHRRILNSAAFPVVTFTPTDISGLPDNIIFGEEITLQITGDLAITGSTRPVTFEVAVLPVSAERLEGRATTSISRADFGIVVPSATSVAGVDDEIELALHFAAAAGG